MTNSPQGTRLTYVGTWSPTGWQYLTASVSDSEVVANVSNDLSNNQGITVESSNVDRPYISGTLTITLHVLDNIGHADIDDVRRCIDHSFYVAASNSGGVMGSTALGNTYPDSSRITGYTLPGAAQETATGSPPAPPATSTGDTPPDLANVFSPSNWGTSTWVFVGAVVVGLALIAFTASKV